MQENVNGNRNLISDKFFALLKATSLERHSDRDHVYLGRSYGRHHLLLGWRGVPYQEAIEALRKANPQVSARAAGQALTHSVVEVFERHYVNEEAAPEVEAQPLDSIYDRDTMDASIVKQEIRSLVKRIRSEVHRRTAFAFIEGLETNIPRLELGHGTLYPSNTGPLMQVLEGMKELGALEHACDRIEAIAEDCRCYLTIDVEGESAFVDQEARRRAQDITNVLVLYMVTSLHREAFYRGIRVIGHQGAWGPRLAVTCTPPISEDCSERLYRYSLGAAPKRYHTVRHRDLDQWKAKGLENVLDAIKPMERSPGSVESRIYNAVTWYGRAMSASTVDEQVVGLTTALESLLVAGGERRIGERLGYEVSALLGGDFENRKRTRETVESLYKVRSQVLHLGEPASREDLIDLNGLAAATIWEFARREMPRS